MFFVKRQLPRQPREGRRPGGASRKQGTGQAAKTVHPMPPDPAPPEKGPLRGLQITGLIVKIENQSIIGAAVGRQPCCIF